MITLGEADVNGFAVIAIAAALTTVVLVAYALGLTVGKDRGWRECMEEDDK